MRHGRIERKCLAQGARGPEAEAGVFDNTLFPPTIGPPHLFYPTRSETHDKT